MTQLRPGDPDPGECFVPFRTVANRDELADCTWRAAPRLSIKATAILTVLNFATADGWATIDDLVRPSDGLDSIKTGLRELVAAGQVHEFRSRNSNGTAGKRYYCLPGVEPPVIIHTRAGNEVTDVYRYFDEYEILLYVGVTEEIRRRRAGHERDSDWTAYVLTSTTRRYPNRAAAEIVEAEAIAAECPIFNRAGLDPQLAEARQTRYLEARMNGTLQDLAKELQDENLALQRK